MSVIVHGTGDSPEELERRQLENHKELMAELESKEIRTIVPDEDQNARVIERFFGMFREQLKAEWNGEGYEVGLFYIMPVKIPRHTIGGRAIEVDGWDVSVGIPPTGDVVELGQFLGIGLAAQCACKEHAAMLARIELDRMADDAAAKDWEETQEMLKNCLDPRGEIRKNHYGKQ